MNDDDEKKKKMMMSFDDEEKECLVLQRFIEKETQNTTQALERSGQNFIHSPLSPNLFLE